MSTQGPTKLWAVADVFEQRLQSSLANLKSGHEKQMEVPAGAPVHRPGRLQEGH